MVFVNNLDPVLFSIGPVSIHWYGLFYAFSVLIVYLYCRAQIKNGSFKTTLEAFDNGYFWIIIGMLLGARLGEVLFYSPAYYFANPLKMLYVWQGGLSFHGGLIGGVIATYLWSRRQKISFLHVVDILTVPTALAQALGRLGNFFNQELPGKVWDGPWAVVYPLIDEYPRHPVQIYEIIYNLIVFFILFSLRNKKMPAGSIFALFLMLYSFFRFVVEFFKVPEVFFAGLAIGQWLSVLMFIAGAGLWFYVHRSHDIENLT